MSAEEVLHKIFDRLGGIDARLEAGGRRHSEFAQAQAEIETKVDALVERVGKVESLAARISIIEPALWQLETQRIESQGVTKFFGGVMTKGRAAAGIVSGSVGAALTGFLAWFLHLFASAPPPTH